MKGLDLEHLRSWIGHSDCVDDIIDARRVAQMAGSLGFSPTPALGDPLPMPWHWLFFTPIGYVETTGSDGHPVRGGFLPPVPLPRRMWASSKVLCHGPLRIGDPARRESKVQNVEEKRTRGESLLFVTVEHSLFTSSGDLLIEEQQHLVYREPPPAAASVKPDSVDPDMPDTLPQWETTVAADPVMLFRYSALTFNAHRIHYDRNYAVNEEGYPGLVVHGPLIASLLLKLAYDNLGFVSLRELSFRARRPVFDRSPMLLRGAREGDLLTLWALTPEGRLAMFLNARLFDE